MPFIKVTSFNVQIKIGACALLAVKMPALTLQRIPTAVDLKVLTFDVRERHACNHRSHQKQALLI